MTREELLALLDVLPGETHLPLRWVREQVAGLAPAGAEPDGADLTVGEVAERWGRGPSTIRGMCEAGEIAGAYKFRNREWRIPRESVAAFEGAQRAGKGQAGPKDRHGLRAIVEGDAA